MLKEKESHWYYSISYFFISNQVLLRRLAVVLLILINIIIWWIGGVKLANYLADTKNFNLTLDKLSQSYINWEEKRLINKPQDLKILSVDKISENKNTYTLLAEIYNPNLNWHAKEIKYYFTIDNFVTEEQSDFILPQQKKYLFKFSFKSAVTPQNITLKIKSTAWQKTKKEPTSSLLDNIIISDKKLNVQNQTTSLKFKVYNNTPYSWWNVGWQIILKQGSRTVATHYAVYHSFLANEEKTLSVSWDKNISANQIIIQPDINLYDQQNYITNVDMPPINLIQGAKTFRSHE